MILVNLAEGWKGDETTTSLALRSFSSLEYKPSVASTMGSGDWLKNIINLSKSRKPKSKKIKAENKLEPQIQEKSKFSVNDADCENRMVEDIAATRIQTAFRAFKVEWSGGFDTIDEALARIQQREEAAVKRERAMAYAFSHQWRPNSRSNLGPYDSEAATANWGWSWLDRWIAVQPWENRVMVELTPKKVNTPEKKSVKNSKSPSMKNSKSMKTSPNGLKNTPINRKLSYPSIKTEKSNTKIETLTKE
ncbi:hypothetical protein L1887_17408 [Cichorium endivia]|nr:hypothetical protein L1887_17408 [Cichorium endivia]